jgi:hypothetical protein
VARGLLSVDIYARAREIRAGIMELAFIAELDQEAMAFRAECARKGTPLALAAEKVFHAADDDPDEWAQREAVAAWALREPPSLDDQ